MHVRPLALMSAVAAVAVAGSVHASTITVGLVNTRASLIRSAGLIVGSNNEEWPAVGAFGADGNFPAGFNTNGGFAFQLPAIPEGEKIDSIVFNADSSLSWYQPSALANLPTDIYGLRISTSKDFAATDYGSGASQPGTKLSDAWFTGPLGALPAVNVSDWVATTGYVAGQYVLLRSGTTADEATITSSQVRWWTDAKKAQLTITTSPIPEPAGLGLLSLSGALVLRRRR